MLATSREARYLLQSPESLPDGFWDGIDSVQLGRDFLLQRQVGWVFWGEVLRLLPGSSQKKFMVWQTWYSREDLQRTFRHLYEKLGVSGRRERRPFTLFAIKQALLWNDQKQFEEADWDAARFARWFAAFDTDEKQRAIPGMQKILFNQEVMHFLLQNYSNLEICQKQRQTHKECAALSWPEQAVFLKTSWRRSENGFLVESFATDAESLRQQWDKPQWTASGAFEPDPQQSFAIRLPSGQKFHLTGLHASLRMKQQWFWTSLWLGSESGQELAVDQADTLQEPWKNYRLCSVDAWQTPLRQQTIDAAWPGPLADFARLLVDKGLWNWCSNPYLEPGPNNHKTNCIGCHQHAGLNWTQHEFVQRLTDDLSSLIHRTSPQGLADYVWSLFAGPDPLVQPLMDDIEFFDVYDPFQ
jgi:hypothetical protein